jgi:hypothetical protein
MKLLTYVILMLFVSVSFCTQDSNHNGPKLIKGGIEQGAKDEPEFVIDSIEVNSNDTIMFSSQNIKLDATVIIPHADQLFILHPDDQLVKVGNIMCLFIPLEKTPNRCLKKPWTSHKYIVKQHKTDGIAKITYEYSIYIHKSMKMVESKSSPKIIVDP